MAFMRHPKYGFRPYKRHSLVLTVAGLAYVIYGLLILFTWEHEGPRASAISAGLSTAPLAFWGALFVLAGIVALVSSRWPAVSEKWGYVVLTGQSANWAAVYLAGLLFDNNTLAQTGGALLWGLLAFLCWALTGLMNPDDVVILEVEVPEDG